MKQDLLDHLNNVFNEAAYAAASIDYDKEHSSFRLTFETRINNVPKVTSIDRDTLVDGEIKELKRLTQQMESIALGPFGRQAKERIKRQGK